MRARAVAEELAWTAACARPIFGPVTQIQVPPNLTPEPDDAAAAAGGGGGPSGIATTALVDSRRRQRLGRRLPRGHSRPRLPRGAVAALSRARAGHPGKRGYALVPRLAAQARYVVRKRSKLARALQTILMGSATKTKTKRRRNRGRRRFVSFAAVAREGPRDGGVGSMDRRARRAARQGAGRLGGFREGIRMVSGSRASPESAAGAEKDDDEAKGEHLRSRGSRRGSRGRRTSSAWTAPCSAAEPARRACADRPARARRARAAIERLRAAGSPRSTVQHSCAKSAAAIPIPRRIRIRIHADARWTSTRPRWRRCCARCRLRRRVRRRG